MLIRTLGVSVCALAIGIAQMMLAPPLSVDGPPRIGRLDGWHDIAWTYVLPGLFGVSLWLVGLSRGRQVALVGPAAWAVAFAAVPPHPMNFCANGGREDFALAYFGMAILAGPAALIASFGPRSVLAQIAATASALLLASVPLFAEGVNGDLLAALAVQGAVACTVLALLSWGVAWARERLGSN